MAVTMLHNNLLTQVQSTARTECKARRCLERKRPSVPSVRTGAWSSLMGWSLSMTVGKADSENMALGLHSHNGHSLVVHVGLLCCLHDTQKQSHSRPAHPNTHQCGSPGGKLPGPRHSAATVQTLQRSLSFASMKACTLLSVGLVVMVCSTNSNVCADDLGISSRGRYLACNSVPGGAQAAGPKLTHRAGRPHNVSSPAGFGHTGK